MNAFQGPCRYIKKDRAFKNINRADILDASIEGEGDIVPLQSNKFNVERKLDTFFVYHSYDYLIDDGKLQYGRWYNGQFPLDSFKRMRGTVLQIHLDSYEYNDNYSGPADVTIHFTEKAAGELKDLL